MKKLHFNKRRKFIFFSILAIGLISLDFITATFESTSGTYRYESEFDAITAATVSVGLVPSDYDSLSKPASRSSNLTIEQVEEMVALAVEEAGGFDGIIDKGDVVMLKVNLVGSDSPSGEGENTDVRVVRSLMKVINEYCEGDVTIQIAEGTARTNDDPNSSTSVWANSGYRDLLSDNELSDINFSLLNLNQGVDDLVEIDLGTEATSAPQEGTYSVNVNEIMADVYISVPVLKIHDTGITNALKLQVGTAPGCYYGYNKTKGTDLYPQGLVHDVDHRRWTTEAIVDLCNVADIDFVVVDALMILESYKTYNGGNQVQMNTIMAGVDPVAVDHVAAKMLGLNPDDIAHITLAEKIGLGTNNPEKIYVHGAALKDVMRKVKKNQAENGKFGQSNRTWILSEAFEGNDVETEFISNEATLKAEPNKNGWSEAVYFFDDRIDLANYYNGANNVVSYAYTNFYAPATQTAELWFGKQEAAMIYLNGEVVYKNTKLTSYNDDDIGAKVADITISKGENNLLVKTVNKYGGDYSFALNICEVESNSLYFGNRVDGLKFYQGSLSSKEELQTAVSDFKCFPSPAETYTTFSFTDSRKNATVTIFDIKGRRINKLVAQNTNSVQWNLTDFYGNRVRTGMYICNLQSGKKLEQLKILVK